MFFLLRSGKSALNSPMNLSRRTKKELREVIEIITPAFKDYLIGLFLFLLAFGVLFLSFGFGPK